MTLYGFGFLVGAFAGFCIGLLVALYVYLAMRAEMDDLRAAGKERVGE